MPDWPFAGEKMQDAMAEERNEQRRRWELGVSRGLAQADGVESAGNGCGRSIRAAFDLTSLVLT